MLEEKRYTYITPDDYIAAEANGIRKDLLEQRVRLHNWDIDRAVNTPMKKRGNGFQKVWDEWKDVALAHGVSRALMYSRVRQSGWEPKRAATEVVGTSTGGYGYGKFTAEDMALAKKHGTDRNSLRIVRQRMSKLGWDKHTAITTPPLSEEERVKRVVEGTHRYMQKHGANKRFNKNKYNVEG